ncbi:hypothetical protein ACJX0J_038262, partial [Zea mays]
MECFGLLVMCYFCILLVFEDYKSFKLNVGPIMLMGSRSLCFHSTGILALILMVNEKPKSIILAISPNLRML